MARALVLVVALVAAGCASAPPPPPPPPPAPPAPPAAPSRPIRVADAPDAKGPGPAWEPLYRLAGGDRGEGRERAERQLRDGILFARALARGFTMDEDMRARIFAAEAALAELDLEALHGLLPDELPGGWREVRFRGRREGGRYVLGRDASPAAAAPVQLALGDVAMAVRSRPVAPAEAIPGYEQNLLLDVETTLGLGAIGADAFARAVAALIDLGHAASSDEELRALVGRDFPRTTAALAEVIELRDIFFDDPPPLHGPRRIRLAFGPAPGLETRYPRMAGWFERVRETGATVRFDLRDGDASIARAEIRLVGPSFVIELHAAPGALVPFTDRGTGPLARAVSPLGKGPLAAEGHVSVEGAVAGLRFRILDLGSRYLWRRDPADGALAFRVSYERMPRQATLTGELLGFVPLDVVDLFIPSTVEDRLQRFMRVFVRGNRGRGSVFSTRLTNEPGARLTVRLEAEVPRNTLVRFFLRRARPRVGPTSETRAEMRRFFAGVVEGFEQDFRAVRVPR